MDPAIDDIHRFWFGELDDNGLCAPQQRRLWFRKSDDTDRLCREQFGMLVDHAVAGGLESWADSDRGRVALVLLLETCDLQRGLLDRNPGVPQLRADLARLGIGGYELVAEIVSDLVARELREPAG